MENCVISVLANQLHEYNVDVDVRKKKGNEGVAWSRMLIVKFILTQKVNINILSYRFSFPPIINLYFMKW